MNTDEERVQLTQLCRKLGAPTAEAAAVMAGQLIKRADQLMVERGLTRVASMQHLLQLVTQGSQGVTPPGFEGGRPPTPKT
jgi:hypothetical protein